MIHIFKITFLFLLVLFIFLITGNINIYIKLMLISEVHELGHLIISSIFNYKIDKILIVPFGFISIFNYKLNDSMIKELILTVMGPLFQIPLFYLLKEPLLIKYNCYLLLFNLLPIIPLDGSKIVSIILYNILPFKIVNKIICYISFITLFLLIRPNLTIILIIICYVISTIKYYKNIGYMQKRLIIDNISCKGKIKIVKNENMMYKYNKNIVYNNQNKC